MTAKYPIGFRAYTLNSKKTKDGAESWVRVRIEIFIFGCVVVTFQNIIIKKSTADIYV